MNSKGKKVKAINPSTAKFEIGKIKQDKTNQKLYQIEFSTGLYWISKSQVQFID